MTQRIITGAALVAILVLALWGGGLWFSVPYMITICMSMYEMIRATAQAGHRPVQWPCWLCVLLSIPLFHFVGSVSLLSLPCGRTWQQRFSVDLTESWARPLATRERISS